MSKKVPPKGKYKATGTGMGFTLKPAKRAAPAKKSGRQTTANKATSCFDGAGDLNPAKTKTGQPNKR